MERQVGPTITEQAYAHMILKANVKDGGEAGKTFNADRTVNCIQGIIH